MVFKFVFLCAFAFVCVAGSCYRPIKPPCGCRSGKVIVTEEVEKISCRPSKPAYIKSGYPNVYPSGFPNVYSSGYSNSVSIDVPMNGGAFTVTSTGPIAPSGIAIATDLGLAGDVLLSGELPYLSAVAFEGQFATAGEVPVSYGCGDGYIGITEQIGGVNAGAGAYGISKGCGCACLY